MQLEPGSIYLHSGQRDALLSPAIANAGFAVGYYACG